MLLLLSGRNSCISAATPDIGAPSEEEYRVT